MEWILEEHGELVMHPYFFRESTQPWKWGYFLLKLAWVW